jgi:hypothetical protein
MASTTWPTQLNTSGMVKAVDLKAAHDAVLAELTPAQRAAVRLEIAAHQRPGIPASNLWASFVQQAGLWNLAYQAGS